jgi:hypothetical protein
VSEHVREPQPEQPVSGGPATRHVLITQCLQNDLFLDPECRLFIGDDAVRKLLVAKHDYEAYRGEGDPRKVPARMLERGPLWLFLDACVGKRLDGRQAGMLHVINIRDWHVPDDSYDNERRLYGRHCEAGTWGAGYVDGLEQYLDPAAALPDTRAAFCERGNVRIYHVHSDSVFDFRPRWEERHVSGGKFHPSNLERLLDVLLTGSDETVERLAATFRGDAEVEADEHAREARRQSQALNELAAHAVRTNAAAANAQLYVAVIGVYTDIKVTILLSSLRARYEIANLAVSDTLTASKSLERHLHGLDFADKLLNAEVIHGLGDLCRFLGTEPPLDDESQVVGAENYAQFKTYFADKQSVLAYESEKLQEYAQLTGRRSLGVYETVRRANTFLIVWGSAFLALAFVGTLLHFADPTRWSWQLTVATGGIGLLQLVAAFFTKPMRDLQQNLNNLASFRMILEGHSLKTAFARYHLTTPEVLRELKDPGDADRAAAQVNALEQQLSVIDRFQTADYQALDRAVGFHDDASNGSNGSNSSNPSNGSNEPAAQPAAPAES